MTATLPASLAQTVVSVHAAGSLRAAFTELARAREAASAVPVRTTFGASGLLKDRLVAGEASDLFASANMEHPRALAAAGRAEAPVAFARNALCLLATPTFSLQGRSVAQRLLDADVRMATSTPKADPAGDYAYAMFDRIEATGAGPAGSAAALKTKALQLTGGPNSPPPPAGRNTYAAIMAAGQADVFVTYCTNAAVARREVPSLQMLAVPDAINISATYGAALLRPVSAPAQAFLAFVLGPQGQAILAAHGFSPP
jgi:ABC-type molybdate transport system substrate-binding protein